MRPVMLLCLVLALGCSSTHVVPLDDAFAEAAPGPAWNQGLLVDGYVTADGVQHAGKGYLWPGPGGGVRFLPFDRPAQSSERVIEFAPGQVVAVLHVDASNAHASTDSGGVAGPILYATGAALYYASLGFIWWGWGHHWRHHHHRHWGLWGYWGW